MRVPMEASCANRSCTATLVECRHCCAFYCSDCIQTCEYCNEDFCEQGLQVHEDAQKCGEEDLS